MVKIYRYNGTTEEEIIPIEDKALPDGVVMYDAATNRLKTTKDLQLTSLNVVDRIVVAGISYLNGDVIADKNITVHGDLIVDGTTYTTDEQSVDTTSDYVILRHNAVNGLSNNEKSGVVVHNYDGSGKTAAIGVDHDGTWRVADNAAEHLTTYTNISKFGDTFYDGLEQSQEEEPIINGATVSRDADELSDCVWLVDRYYYHDNQDWFELSLVDSKIYFDIDNPIDDEALISQLDSLDKQNLEYYRKVTVLTIDDTQNEPLLTRDEASNLTDGLPLVWDSANNRAVSISSPTNANQTIVSKKDVSGNYYLEWSTLGSGSVFVGTTEEFDEAVKIPLGEDGYLPDNSIVVITDAEQPYITGDNIQ